MKRIRTIPACLALLLAAAAAQSAPPPARAAVQAPAARGIRLDITVLDENNLPVAQAQVVIEDLATHQVRRGETDSAGRLWLSGLEAVAYRVRVDRTGFYPLTAESIHPAPAMTLELQIHHHQPVGEVVNVSDVAPGIDPQQTARSETLNSRDIVNIPYPTTRDVRNVLTYIPGVVQDRGGTQVHIAGAASYQTDYVLDRFTMNQPVTGLFELRVSPDAVRTIDAETSRYSAQYGHGSGGVLALDTRTGDDNYRFSFVNFLPTFQTTHGPGLNNWVPRATFSGPLRRKRAWFYLSQDAEVDNQVVKELPHGADRNLLWRVGDLAKVQVNLTPGNVLSTSFLYNYLDSPNSFISALTPQSATVNQQQTSWMFTLRDQAYLAHATLLEVGLAASEFRDAERPQGSAPYQVTPQGVAGNYYRTGVGHSRRVQGIANLYLPPARWHGQHDLRLGLDISGIDYRQSFQRGPTLVYDERGVLTRKIAFLDAPAFNQGNIEAGFWAQDRWSPVDRLVVEGGLRTDRDQVVRYTAISPRLAASYTLGSDRKTKLSAGVGLFHDQTRLVFITRPLEGQRLDSFYAPDGITLTGPPAITQFAVQQQALEPPRFLNWSVGLERMLPGSLYGKFEFVDRHGGQGFAFVNQAANPAAPGGAFLLTNQRADHYDGFQMTLRRDFHNNHALLASYARSSARTNRALEFTLDNPIFGQQGRGPLPWDAPDRIISWGWLPMPWLKRTDFAYSLEWRTGFPFNIVNAQQQLVGRPDRTRFPYYFTFNPALERVFQFLGYQFALRGGIDDITGRRNPVVVNNNIDSPQFLTFSGSRHRTFNGRIRFLGKK